MASPSPASMPRPTDSLSMSKARAVSERAMPRPTSAPPKRAMPRLGSARSRPRHLPDAIVSAVVVMVVWAAFAQAADGEALQPHRVVDDAIPEWLTGATGDSAAGRAIVVDRRLGACLLCHTGPFAEERFQGTLAPDLSGAGSRGPGGQLRLRLGDATRLHTRP